MRLLSDESVVSSDGGGKDLRPDQGLRPLREGAGMQRLASGHAAASGPSSQEEDLKLIRAIAQGGRREFEALYYRYAPRLGRYLFRLLRQREAVEEAINDVMMVVWQSAARFEATSRLSAWLFGIAHNKALKALARSSTRGREVPLDIDEAGDDDGPADPVNPEWTLIGRRLGQALASALDELSAEHRAVIELAFCEDCSYQEIAVITACPVNTVKTRMFHARRRLAQLLAARGMDH
jgi:RNA polymerase sigma-70 factor (ECF subfamily)